MDKSDITPAIDMFTGLSCFGLSLYEESESGIRVVQALTTIIPWCRYYCMDALLGR